MSVNYTRINFVNGTTPLNATNMNKLDKGVNDCAAAINAVESSLGDAAGRDVGIGANDVAAGNHNHDERYYTRDQVDDAINGINLTSHNHDERYYKKSEVDSALAGKASASHTHDNRYYTESEVDTKLAGKANTNHTHDNRYYTESEVNGLISDLRAEIRSLESRVYALEHGGGVT